jgi:hypothetical protein
MDDELPKEVSKVLKNMDEVITSLEKTFEPFFKEKLVDITQRLTPLEAAKLNIVMAYAINTLYYCMFTKNTFKIFRFIYCQSKTPLILNEN